MNNENSEKEKSVPSVSAKDIEAELGRVSKNSGRKAAVAVSVVVIVILTAGIYLLNSMLTPVIRINGNSMTPTLENGSIAISLKTKNVVRGDICYFYCDNRILCKRIIGMPGDSVVINDDGSVYVNGGNLNETYVSEKVMGECNIEFPFTVPEGTYFVLGDNRSISDDSRNLDIGCIAADNILGRVIFCIWPFSCFGTT